MIDKTLIAAFGAAALIAAPLSANAGSGLSGSTVAPASSSLLTYVDDDGDDDDKRRDWRGPRAATGDDDGRKYGYRTGRDDDDGDGDDDDGPGDRDDDGDDDDGPGDRDDD